MIDEVRGMDPGDASEDNLKATMDSRDFAVSDLAVLDFSVAGRALLFEIAAFLVAQGVGQRSALERAHFTAVKNGWGKFRPADNASGRERIQGYREAYYHLREMGALQKAVKVMRVSLAVQKRGAVERWEGFRKEEEWKKRRKKELGGKRDN